MLTENSYANNNSLYLSGTTHLNCFDYFTNYTFVAVEDFGGGDKRLVLKNHKRKSSHL